MDFPQQNNHRETPSSGVLGARYYSGGEIARVPAPHIHKTSHLTNFRMVDAKQVRAARGDTTAAMEITLKIEGDDAATIARQMQPGLFFAFEPKNDAATVDAILDCLKPSEQEENGRIHVPVHSAYMATNTAQLLPKRDVLAGLVDVSRPTEQLVELLAVRAECAGQPMPLAYDPVELTKCYTVAELLAYRPGLLTVEDVYANQPAMKPRPYTISDFDVKRQTVNILISGVSAELSKGDPLGLKPSTDARTKDGGTATGMLMDLAVGGTNGAPDGEYRLNGYLLTGAPRLVFPGSFKRTEAVQDSLTGVHGSPERRAYFKAFEKVTPDTTLYLLATGSGMAPYMSLLRDLSRRKQADEGFEKPCNIVLINGGRYAEDELYAEECRQFVKDGLLDAYHAAASSTGKEKYVTLKNGKLHETELQGKTENGARYYIQDVLSASYGKDMDAQLRSGKAMVYVCGTQGALRGVFGKWPDAFRANHTALQHTASVPGRFFDNMWRRANEATSYREPLPVERRSQENPAAWTKRILKIVAGREGGAAQSHAR